jgi:uncharacterized protein (DUF2267 family)
MVKTRKEFLEKLMQLANIETLERADEIAQVVISLIKAEIGEDLSARIANTVPEDLGKGWRQISLEITRKEFSGEVTPEEHEKIKRIHRKDFNGHVNRREHKRVQRVLKRDFG